MAKKLNVDTITNASIRKKLGLSGSGKRHFQIPPAGVFEQYFGEYSTSAKAYKTRDIPNPFFWEVAKFLLEAGCIHTNAYGMPKKKASIVITTFEGHSIDWGVIMGPTLRDGLHAIQAAVSKTKTS